MYIAVAPLLDSVAVNSKLYPGIVTELRGALFSLILVSPTPKILNVKLCSGIRVVSHCEKKVKRYSNGKKIDSSFSYLIKIKAHRARSIYWKLFQMKR